MSQFRPRAAAAPSVPRRADRRRRLALATAAGAGLLAVGVALASAGSGPAGGGLARTGEVNAMGMPVVETPGSGRGTASAGGVVVDDAVWDLGRVPLDVAVRPTWTLRNTGSVPVALGEPHPEVREGCCPGPAILGDRLLGPGETTTLTFELSMHPGMDGPHDLGLHVPVDSGTGAGEYLTLDVLGDFRD